MKKRNNNISEEDFRRYLENRMSEAERNRFERELQKHPFEAEAMEGYENTPTNLQAELKEVKSRIAGKKRKNTYRYWAAAATVLLLVTAGLIWFQLGDEPATPEVAVLETDKAVKETVPAATDSVEEEIEVSESDKTKEIAQTELQTRERDESIPETVPEPKQQSPVAAVTDSELPEGKSRESQVPQKARIAKNEAVKSARDTKSVSYGLAADQSTSAIKTQMKSLAETKKGTIVLTEKAEFPINSDDIFPDSFKTVPAEEREKIQEIRGVAVQDNVELEGDAYLSDIAARPEIGIEKWNNYLEKHALLPENYPEKKKTVKLLLEIDSQGNISSIQNQNNADALLFERSKNIIRNGPKWNPKVLNGQRVQSEVKLTIDFKKK